MQRIGTAAVALTSLLACGGQADPAAPAQAAGGQGSAGSADVPPANPAQPPGQPQPPSELPPTAASIPPAAGTISTQDSASCVALPVFPARQPGLSYADGCAVTEFEPTPSGMIMAGGVDARGLLVGRWQLCGDTTLYSNVPHDGIEFGSNGRNQLLSTRSGSLAPIANAPKGIYYLLGSGQFMQRGELFSNYASFIHFDSTQNVMQVTPNDGGDQALRYVRVAPDDLSAATNSFSTTSDTCSMVGVWDTAPNTNNPPAAFAFNERGEWYGGDWGSDLCAAHSMYGTYNLETRGGPVEDNFNLVETQFELVTNIGAGACQFWFNAAYQPTFSPDCNTVHLAPVFDNCTGGRGYLNAPGDDLVRRQ